jgi:hypothetical protein
VAGQTVPNLVVARVGLGGKVALFNGSSGSTDLVADVAGYVVSGSASAAGSVVSVGPARVLDSRAGVGVARARVAAHGTVHLKVTGVGGVPASGVAAVVLNVTVVHPARAGYVTVYADGSFRPTASNLNFVAGQTVPNLVVARVGLGGKVALFNGSSGSTDLVADVAGYVLSGASGAGPDSAYPCGYSGSGGYAHVVWIFMENKSYGAVIGSNAAPYENALAQNCGLAGNYQGIAHPSLPNYLAATAGSTFGVTDDLNPAKHPIPGSSLFSQLTSAGLSWRAYEESMPSPCRQGNSGLYAVRHNPAAYFTDIRTTTCPSQDLPLEGHFAQDVASGNLPSFSFVTPNLCNDMHNCSVATGDAWLSNWVGDVLDGPNYRSGNTLVVITWDEGDAASNRIPTIVIAPRVPNGTVSQGAFTHFSLLRTTEELLGLPLLRSAGSATSMASAFHL